MNTRAHLNIGRSVKNHSKTIAVLALVLGFFTPFTNMNGAFSFNYQEIQRFGRGSAESVAWSPNGEYLAVGGGQGIWLYDRNLEDVAHFDKNIRRVTKLIWSSDGQYLYALTHNFIQFWAVREQTLIHEAPFDIRAFDMALSPTNQLIAVSGQDLDREFIKIWDLDTPENILAVTIPARIMSLTWGSTDTQIIGMGQDGNMYIWDTTTGDLLQTMNVYQSGTLISVDNQRNYFLTVGWDDNRDHLDIWDMSTFEKLFTYDFDGIYAVAWSMNDTYVAFSSKNQLNILDIAKKEITQEIPIEGTTLTTIAWNNDYLATSSPLTVWDTSSGNILAQRTEHSLGASLLAWSPDNQYIAYGGGEYFIVKIIEPMTGEVFTSLDLVGASPISDLEWSFDSRYIAVAYPFNFTKVWDLDGTDVATLVYPVGTDLGTPFLAWHPNQLILATSNGAFSERSVITWDIAPPNTDILENIAFEEATWVDWNSKGNLIAITRGDVTIDLWDVDDKAFINDLDLASSSRIEWHPSQDQLAGSACSLASGECHLWIWDLAQQQKFMTLPETIGRPYAMAWNPDGNLLAVAWWQEIVFWDISRNIIVGRITSKTDGGFITLDWNSDGTLLASGNSDGSLSIWKIENP